MMVTACVERRRGLHDVILLVADGEGVERRRLLSTYSERRARVFARVIPVQANRYGAPA